MTGLELGRARARSCCSRRTARGTRACAGSPRSRTAAESPDAAAPRRAASERGRAVAARARCARARAGSSRSTPARTATRRRGSRRSFGRRLALAVARHRIAGEEARNLAARAVGRRLGIRGRRDERRAHPRPARGSCSRTCSPACGTAPRWTAPAGGSSRTRSGRSRGRRRWRGSGATSPRGSRPPPRSPTRAGSGWRRSAASTRCRRWSSTRATLAGGAAVGDVEPGAGGRATPSRPCRTGRSGRPARPSFAERGPPGPVTAERRDAALTAERSRRAPRRPDLDRERSRPASPAWRSCASSCAKGARWRYGGEPPEDVARQLARELDARRAARVRELLPHRLGRRSVRALARDPLPGEGQRGELSRLLRARHHRDRPGPDGLLFERFISAERGEPPDIDVDFEHERREEVLQYVYERYGRDRAGMVCEVITYRGKSALRDVGKALGLSLAQVDRLAKRIGMYEDLAEVGPELARPGRARRRRVGARAHDARARARAAGVPAPPLDPRRRVRHHAPAALRDRAIEPAAMPGRTIVQWDKDDLAELDLLKVDLLGLGMLDRALAGARAPRRHRPRACARRRRCRTRLARDDPRRGPGRLRDAREGGHHRRVPDRVARADVARAAAQAAELLRPRHLGRDRPPRARSRAG